MPQSDSNSQEDRSRKGVDKDNREGGSQDDDNSCLYIGNIDKKLSQQKLREYFAEHGTLDYCYIVYEPYSSSDRSARNEPKQSRGYGFAKFKTNEEAARAKEKLQGADLNGRRITVDFSKRSKPREPTPGKYLGKKKQSPVRRSHRDRRSYSRSSSRSNRRSSKRTHEKRRRHSRSRSRSDSHRRQRQSYSKSPRR